jgi:hypothetical protein
MAILTLRQTNPASGTNKGAPLTNAEVDANFNSLDSAKLEKTGGTMTGTLVLAAGTTAIAPMKLQVGANLLTTPETGALEFDGSNLLFTPSTSRKFLAYTDSNITGTSAGWTAARTVAFATGDVTGSFSINGTANVSNVALTIANDSVALGTKTTGNYVATVQAGTGVSTTGATTGEGVSHIISIGQPVGTDSGVTFGSVNVGSATGAASGQIKASGDIIAFSSSDERLKTDVAVISDALSKVKTLRGVTYTWNETAEQLGLEGKDTGVIAQEVVGVLPEVVTTREDGHMAVKYEKMIGLLIEAIKELDDKLSKCNCAK